MIRLSSDIQYAPQPPGAGHEDDEKTAPSLASSPCYVHPLLQRGKRDLAKEMRRHPSPKRGNTSASGSSLPFTFLMDDISIAMTEEEEGQHNQAPRVDVDYHNHGGPTAQFLFAPVFRPISPAGERAVRPDNVRFATGICFSSARLQPFCGENAAFTSNVHDLLVRAGSFPRNSDISARAIQNEIINTFCQERRQG
jgi:hypothetical protein